jgi:hypothetical protein
MNIYTHPLGTVSHGTMNPEHLIPVLTDVLEDLVQRSDWCGAQHHRDTFVSIIWDAREALDDDDAERASDAVGLLFDALDGFAPEGAYFGAHPGDGSDYGFWPLED